MNNFSTEQTTQVTFDEDFLINIDTIAHSLQRIAEALDALAGVDTDER